MLEGGGIGSCGRGGREGGDGIMWAGGRGWVHVGGGKGTGEHCERCLSARF